MRYVLSIAVLLLVACGTVTTAPSVDYVPIPNCGNERIAVVATQNTVLGSIGQHHDGILSVAQYTWTIGSNVNATFPVVVTDILRNELVLAGYDAVNMSTTVITSSMEENLTLSIGSVITSINVNTYSPLCGNKSIAYVTMRFEITDLATGQQVFVQAFDGSATAQGSDPIAGVTMAAQNAIRGFLANAPAASFLAGSPEVI